MRTLIPLLATAIAATAAACTGPALPEGALASLSVDVARDRTAITIDGEVEDPGDGPAGHAISVQYEYADWTEAAASPHTVVAGAPSVGAGGGTGGSVVVPGGRCVQLCTTTGTCKVADLKLEWSQVQVDRDGNVLLGCVRCEDGNGVKIGGDCPPPP